MAMYYCQCDRWIDHDYDPMDEHGECGMCQDARTEKESDNIEPTILVTMEDATYGFQTKAHARQGLIENPQLWSCLAVETRTGKILKKRGEIVGKLPTYH